MYLQIKPALRRMWRGPSTLQIGLDARHGLIVDGLTDDDVAVLHQLFRGTDSATFEARSGAGPEQPDQPRSGQLLKLLADAEVLNRASPGTSITRKLGSRRHRLIDDAQVWSVVHPGNDDGWELLAARDRRRVEIHGGGRIAVALAGTLTAAGVGSVEVTDRGPVQHRDLAPAGPLRTDLGGTHRDAARSAAARLTDGDSLTPDRPSPPDLVVLVDHGVADSRRADRFSVRDIPQLSVVIQETSALVGPLVLPGRTACLRCLDLHRTDQDGSWPLLLAQLVDHRETTPRHWGVETASAGLVAALSALQVLHHLDGLPIDGREGARTCVRTHPAAVGATLDVRLPDGLITRQEWRPHADCGCSGVFRSTGKQQPIDTTTELSLPVTTTTGRMSL